PLERQVREIARAIKMGVNDDIDAREREEQQRAQAQEAYARQRAEERQTWESIRGQARGKALLEIREATFARAFQDWKQAEELRTFAARLEADAADQQMLEARPRLQQWLQ